MSRATVARLARVGQGTLDAVARLGASAAAVKVRHAWTRALEGRDGVLETFEESMSTALTLRLFAGGRYGVFGTSDLRPASLHAFVERAFDVLGALAPDPDRALPDPSGYRGRPRGDLGLVDPAAPPDRAALARTLARLEAAARAEGADAPVVAVETGASCDRTCSVLLHSDGFRGVREATSASLSVSVVLLDGADRRPVDRAHDRARRVADLQGADVLGQRAMRRARARLDASPAPTGTCPVVVEARAAARLVEALLDAMQGPALWQHRSFLLGCHGQRVASRAFTLVDDPLVPGGMGSRRCDAEGLAARRRVLIRRGVLEGLLLDTCYARKLGQALTSGSASNAVVAPGPRDLEGLLAAAGQGLLVTGFLGGNVNAATGDFSLGVMGSRIERGSPGRAVAGSNLSGNLLELFGSLVETGSDVLTSSAVRTPSLWFGAGQVSGT